MATHAPDREVPASPPAEADGDAAPEATDGVLDEATQIQLLETYHTFPGPFTIVLITSADEAFVALLQATVAAEQGIDSFEIEVRPSRKGNYVAYRIHVHVANARAALDRRRVLATLPDLYAVF
ncbi:MAG: DUF493 domain-containing protein [Ardenticatenales bacterium]|nr:DUF493 domain-containing protein [Ardenticatenales bacterium]